MTLKVKLITAAIIVLVSVAAVISVFVYINNLNNKITDLSLTVSGQNKQIATLNCQIASLEKNIESFRETINITNEYIENIEKARQEEMSTKQEVYETIIEDPVAKEWYDEPLPDVLLNSLISKANDLTCGN